MDPPLQLDVALWRLDFRHHNRLHRRASGYGLCQGALLYIYTPLRNVCQCQCRVNGIETPMEHAHGSMSMKHVNNSSFPKIPSPLSSPLFRWKSVSILPLPVSSFSCSLPPPRISP